MPTVIEQIRESLGKSDGVTEETMLPLAEAYAAEVATVNDRLANCVSLMNRGLRSEALQQANIRPNLVEAAARLDFPEVEEWLEILQFLGIELPRNLNRDAVQQLQEAMVDEQPLEHLMRQHRRLAIGKAPLNWRLRILRQLADADPLNVIWQEDLESWERVRLSQIQSQFDASLKEKDIDECIALLDELRRVKWRINIPKDYLTKVNSATTRLGEESSLRELTEVSVGLNDAYCEQAEGCCQALRNRWESIVSRLKQPVPAELTEAVEPALLWLAERDREKADLAAHQEALSNLEHALEFPKSLDEIQRLYRSASRGGFEIDPLIEERYRVACANFHNTARQRSTLKIGAIVATCVFALALFGFWQYRSSQAAALEKSVASLRQMVDRNELQAAAAFIEKASNATQSAPEFAALTSRFKELKQKADARVEAFLSLIKQADQEDPANIDLQLVKQADQLAETPADKAKVSAIQNRYQQWDTETTRTQFESLNNDIAHIRDEMASLERSNIDELQEASVRPLFDKCDRLKEQYPRAGSNGFSLIDSLRLQLTNLRDTIRKSGAVRSADSLALTQLRSARSLDELRSALESGVRTAQESPLSKAFSQVLDDSRIWKNVETWNAIARSAADVQATQSPDAIDSLLSQYNSLNGSLSGILPENIGSDVIGELERHKKRTMILDELIQDTEESLVRDLVTIEYGILINDQTERARRLALANSIKRDQARIAEANEKRKKGNSMSIPLDIIVDADGEEEKYQVKAPIEVIFQPKAFVEEIILDFRNRRLEILKDWDRSLLATVAKILNSPDIHNYHKLQLVGRTLAAGRAGSKFLESNLRGVLQFIGLELQKPTDWFQVAIVGESDNKLTPELKSKVFDPLSAAYKSLNTSKSVVEILAKSQIEWVGLVARNEQKQFEPLLKVQPLGDGRICLVTTNVLSPDKADVVKVGAVSGGKVVFDRANKDLIEGRPLFFLAN